MNDLRIQAMFERSRHNKLSIFIISHEYYKLPKRAMRANGNIYRVFKSNNFRNVQILYQDKASMDMTLNELKLLASICCFNKFLPIILIPIIINEEDTDLVSDEIVKDEDFGKLDTQLETYESIKKLKSIQEYKNESTIILDLNDSNERKNGLS